MVTEMIRNLLLAASCVLPLLLQPAIARAQVSESADEILRMMSDYLAGLGKFSVAYDTDSEIITGDGQKIQFSAGGSILVRRPDGIHVIRDGAFAATETFFDGNSLTLLGKKANAYFQMDFAGTLDQAIDEFRMSTGMDAPGADLLMAKPYETLMEGVTAGEYVATGYVDGVPCYHLAFREANVDWQLWVSTDEHHPVPMKYVITTKWTTGAPQHTVRLRDWNLDPQISDTAFAFTAPSDALMVDDIEVNEMGELVLKGE